MRMFFFNFEACIVSLSLNILRVKAKSKMVKGKGKDVGEVISLTRRPPFTPRKIPGTHFC
jgi:hypothetical protein